MAGIGYGVRLCSLAVGALPSPITTSRAFNSSGGQVGSTNTGDIPESWVANEATITSVIFANDNSVTSIGSLAFQGCSSLASITIPNSVSSIGSEAFSYLSAITSITIPSGVTTIASDLLRSCTSLSSVTFLGSITSIGSYAFYNCSSLASVTIPNSVTSIGTGAFKDCTSLATVLCYVAQSAFTGSNAFYYTASPLTIRARSTDASWTAGTGLTFQGNTNVTVIKNL